MARYIDREQVCEKCNNKNYCEKEKCPVYKVPSADVVPKSEVDEIIGAFDTWLYKHYNGDISDWDLYKLFAELKKKYTEDQSGDT